MKKILFFNLLIVFSLEGFLKRSRRSKHGEDCYSDEACEEGLFCKLNRCYTKYESLNLKLLGLYETNICDLKKKCKGDNICVKHRCVDKDTPKQQKVTHSEEIDDVHLVFAGNINLNKKPYYSGIKKDGSINYDDLFDNIQSTIKSADLALVPLETAFYISQDGKKVINNPKKTPKELGDAIYKAGFRAVLHAASTAYSLKEKGILDTINFWKINYPDLHVLGISSNLEESNNDYYIYTKNNIKIGIINYSAFVGSDIPQKYKYMVNIISQKKVEETIEKIKNLVDFIIICVNWGKRSSTTPNSIQIKWAKQLASLGVNLIIGYYPIYTQPATFVKAPNGKRALVFFSLGMLVGDNDKKTSDLGALANIVISKVNNRAYISSYSLIPTVNHKTKERYTVYKLTKYNQNLANEVKNKYPLKKLINECKQTMGAFAHCG